jgi:peptidoglycan/xylan/chitin deacetylase (PgdA/CDA1 family)
MRGSDDMWVALDRELSEWGRAGRAASLWWRDDDAVAASGALSRLLALLGAFNVPLTLAVVPKRPGARLPSLHKAIAENPRVTPILHGYAHANHARPGEKQAEFGGHRLMSQMRDELSQGLASLTAIFGAGLGKVLAPPWNRIGSEVLPHLPQLGFVGVTAFRPAATRCPAPGLVQTNCHIDPIDWQGGRAQRPSSEVLGELVQLLRARRLFAVLRDGGTSAGMRLPAGFDPDEPTGILTHHLVHDEKGWEFLGRLLKVIGPHCKTGGAQWLSCADVFTITRDAAQSV